MAKKALLKSLIVRRRRGNAAIEFSLVLLPLTVCLLGIILASKLAWNYQTLANSVKDLSRFSVVHGERCLEASPDCARTLSDLVTRAKAISVGLDPSVLELRLTSGSVVKSCAPLNSCGSSSEIWPPAGENSAGEKVQIEARYQVAPFSLVPGLGGIAFPLVANSEEVIQF